jgi:hypothetical protein
VYGSVGTYAWQEDYPRAQPNKKADLPLTFLNIAAIKNY